jgi:NAD+ kinase
MEAAGSAAAGGAEVRHPSPKTLRAGGGNGIIRENRIIRSTGALSSELGMDIRCVGINAKREKPQAADHVRTLVEWLSERGVEVRVDESCAGLTDARACTHEELSEGADLLVAMGGDGTLLATARAAGTRPIPILGINLGTLGFLTEVGVEEMLPAMERVLAGEVRVEPRMRLEVTAWRDGSERGRFLALNDAVITRTALSRMIDLDAAADGVHVTSYHADGLIVSTPTGSTAYSLSAGGPLLLPGTGVVVLTPICSHALTHRPVVLPQETCLEIHVRTRGGDAALTVDGQEGLDLREGDRVSTRCSPHPARIVCSPFRNRFEILHTKLRWGQR